MEILEKYCYSLNLPIDFTFVNNDQYENTNYIYSIYLAKEYLKDDDICLIHGDLVLENSVVADVLNQENSVMTISTTTPLPEKDFKAVVDNDYRISKVGVEFFDNAVAAQPLYKLNKNDWLVWLNKIEEYCEKDENSRKQYAEVALNDISNEIKLYGFDVKERLCQEIDSPEDLEEVAKKVEELENRLVYMSFSTDFLHSGHIAIINKAARLGKLMIGILDDETVSSYKKYPLLPQEERKSMIGSIEGVSVVVDQNSLSYKENIEKYKPTYVVHGDNWVEGYQKPIREEVINLLNEYGGQLVEYPYASDEKFVELEKRTKAELSTPDIRRGRLRKLLAMKGTITAMEAHDGLTGLIVENTVVHNEAGETHQFDAMWISSLCDSTAKGKPDIELVDMTSRFRTIDDIMEVTTKPIIFDGDTGGLKEHFVYTVKSLERMGVSMVIIEDKTGLKKNSLFGTEVKQTQEDIESFSEKIRAGKNAQKTKDFMICARIESLILEQGMEDALTRAFAFSEAGADAIMIHSRKKEPDEIFEFVEKFREKDTLTPIVVVPTSFNTVTEEEFKERGVNIVIYANQLMRASVPAMQNVANMILENHRAKEADDICMPFNEIIRLIPEEE